MKEIKLEKQVNGCIHCISHCTDSFGYTRLKRNGKHTRLHRYVYEQRYGEIPSGMIIRHICDNPSCCNIKHLIIGTKKDNVDDMFKRNRQCDYEKVSIQIRGSKNTQAKLKEDDVINIFKSKFSYSTLASLYGVSKTTICNIKNGRFWGWLTSKL